MFSTVGLFTSDAAARPSGYAQRRTSSRPDILTTVKATRAAVVFDATGGGTLAMDMLTEQLDGRSKGTTRGGAHVRRALPGVPQVTSRLRSRPRGVLRKQHLST